MELFSFEFFQHYWWIINSLLAALLVFLLFVQGGQSMIFTLAKDKEEQRLIVNSMGRKWEFTFTTLVVFGGAFFASFPLFYSTSFGGAYWAWMALLFCFVIQAVSFEFRTRPNNFLGTKTFNTFLFINGSLAPFLLGVIVATLFTGGNFMVEKYNIINPDNLAISYWTNNWHGLEALLNYKNLLLGFTVLFLARTLGHLYIQNNIDHDILLMRSRVHLKIDAILFLLFFLPFVAVVFTAPGYYFDGSQFISKEFIYFNNIVSMPLILVLFLVGVVLVLIGMYFGIFSKSSKGIWWSGLGVILTVFSLFIVLGFNNTAYYFSLVDPQSSLCLANSSSSEYTLRTMSYVSILVPFVIAYIVYAWRAINNKKISSEEFNEDTHVY